MASGAGAMDAMVAEAENDLRAEGWSDHTSVTRELTNWAAVADTVNPLQLESRVHLRLVEAVDT